MEARRKVNLSEWGRGPSKTRLKTESWEIPIFGKLEKRKESEEPKMG